LLGVEIPLALPVIIAGVRVAAVTTIGLTTVTALIGQGGLGFLILLGIQSFFTTPLLVGAIGSILLAMVTDTALVTMQGLLLPWERRR
jgi:osmoprotectant transport system permease protein